MKKTAFFLNFLYLDGWYLIKKIIFNEKKLNGLPLLFWSHFLNLYFSGAFLMNFAKIFLYWLTSPGFLCIYSETAKQSANFFFISSRLQFCFTVFLITLMSGLGMDKFDDEESEVSFRFHIYFFRFIHLWPELVSKYQLHRSLWNSIIF